MFGTVSTHRPRVGHPVTTGMLTFLGGAIAVLRLLARVIAALTERRPALAECPLRRRAPSGTSVCR